MTSLCVQDTALLWEVALTPGAWGEGCRGENYSQESQRQGYALPQEPPCIPPLAVSCLSCPPESCMVPTPSTQESEKVTHLAGKTSWGVNYCMERSGVGKWEP